MTRVLGLTFSLITLVATPAWADGEKRPLTPDVDFSKPPNQVEGYNKCRITCETEVRPEGRVFKVHGRAYYPDGVEFFINLRYWKHAAHFVQARVTVRDRSFQIEIGPFARPFPGGEITAEAWFDYAKQTRAMQRQLVDQKFMSCTPPCHFDRKNATRVNVNLGGLAAQQQDEKLEKEHLSKAIESISAAFRACEQVCLAARQEKATKEQAAAALQQLQADLDAANRQLQAYKDGRHLLLFPEWAARVLSFSAQSHDVGKHHAAVAGVPVEGLAVGQGAFAELAEKLRLLKERRDELKGFIAEEGTLDREWKALNDQAQATWDQSQAPRDGATTDRPAAGSGKR